MFGVGIPEILIILVIALIVIGPDKLPEIAKTLGKAISEFKKVMDGVKASIEEEQKGIEKGIEEKPAVKTSLKDKEETLKKEYEEAIEEEAKKP